MSPALFEGGSKGNSGERLRYTPCAGRQVRYRLITAPDNPAVGCDRSSARLGPPAAARSIIPLRRCPSAGGLHPLPGAYPWIDGRPDMKIKIRHHDSSMPQEDGWSQMGDWLAELGDDSHTEPPADADAEAGGTDDPWAEAFAQADARAARDEAEARDEADARDEAHGETSATPTAVMTPYLEPRPVQNTTTPDPAPARPAATQHNRPRPLEVAECSLCGIALPLGLLVPDGGQACTDIRWYCKDAMSCAHRWTTATPPVSGHMPAAPDDTSRDAEKAAPDGASAELPGSMSEAAQSAV